MEQAKQITATGVAHIERLAFDIVKAQGRATTRIVNSESPMLVLNIPTGNLRITKKGKILNETIRYGIEKKLAIETLGCNTIVEKVANLKNDVLRFLVSESLCNAVKKGIKANKEAFI